MLDSVFISLDNLRLFGSLIKSSLDEKLSTKDISEWALQKSKPDYDASEIFMVGNPSSLQTRSKYIVDSINEIYNGSAYYFDIDENSVLIPAIGKTIAMDEDGVISIVELEVKMPDFIKGIRTSKGDKKYDYESLGNIPTINGIPIVGNQTTETLNIGLPDSDTVKASIEEWLKANPDATTTVQNGSISKDKLASDLLATSDEIATFLNI